MPMIQFIKCLEVKVIHFLKLQYTNSILKHNFELKFNQFSIENIFFPSETVIDVNTNITFRIEACSEYS